MLQCKDFSDLAAYVNKQNKEEEHLTNIHVIHSSIKKKRKNRSFMEKRSPILKSPNLMPILMSPASYESPKTQRSLNLRSSGMKKNQSIPNFGTHLEKLNEMKVYSGSRLDLWEVLHLFENLHPGAAKLLCERLDAFPDEVSSALFMAGQKEK